MDVAVVGCSANVVRENERVEKRMRSNLDLWSENVRVGQNDGEEDERLVIMVGGVVEDKRVVMNLLGGIDVICRW